MGQPYIAREDPLELLGPSSVSFCILGLFWRGKVGSTNYFC